MHKTEDIASQMMHFCKRLREKHVKKTYLADTYAR